MLFWVVIFNVSVKLYLECLIGRHLIIFTHFPLFIIIIMGINLNGMSSPLFTYSIHNTRIVLVGTLPSRFSSDIILSRSGPALLQPIQTLTTPYETQHLRWHISIWVPFWNHSLMSQSAHTATNLRTYNPLYGANVLIGTLPA